MLHYDVMRYFVGTLTEFYCVYQLFSAIFFTKLAVLIVLGSLAWVLRLLDAVLRRQLPVPFERSHNIQEVAITVSLCHVLRQRFQRKDFVL